MRSVRFSVNERQTLRVGDTLPCSRGGEAVFTQAHLEAIARYVERTCSPAFTLGHKRVRLGHHCGLLRLGPLHLEIWPKLASHDGDTRPWRGLLLRMVHDVWDVRLLSSGQAPLERGHGDLFDLLVARFLDCVEALLRQGLASSYREIEVNSPVFRGRLLVAQQVRLNAAHAERSYVAYEILDSDNAHNRVLRAALETVRRQSYSTTVSGRAEELANLFPSVSLRPIPSAELATLRLDRRTARYREALELARLLLNAQRPDLRWGDSEVLSLLFDMDHLFEAWVAVQLRRIPGVKVSTQRTYPFWQGDRGRVGLRPDIVVQVASEAAPIVVDTKWSVPTGQRPSAEYLRQIYAYLHRVKGKRGMLLYPKDSVDQLANRGQYVDTADLRCDVEFLELFDPSAPGGIRGESVRNALRELLDLGRQERISA